MLSHLSVLLYTTFYVAVMTVVEQYGLSMLLQSCLAGKQLFSHGGNNLTETDDNLLVNISPYVLITRASS